MEPTIRTRRDFLADIGAGAAALAVAPNLARAKTTSPTAKGTGYAYDPRFAQFGVNGGDVPGRVTSINERVAESGLIEELSLIAPHADPMKYVRQVHTDDHIAGIQSIERQSGYLYGKGQIAELAVAHVLGAVQAVCDGTVRNAFCNLRPPGHHVIQGGVTLGYCCYGNVAIAAHFALQKPDIDRVLIIDWDFHQGNGTHSLICGNDNVLFFETFSPFMYTTDCDDLHAIGPDDPVPLDSNRINVQLPSESDNDAFVGVFEEKLVAAADSFHPDLVLISCGFDLKHHDSHGDFFVTSRGVSRLTRIVQDIADTHARGKIVSMLEGGYEDVTRNLSCTPTQQSASFHGLSACAESHLATLLTGDIQEESDFYNHPQRYICDTSAVPRYARSLSDRSLQIEGNILCWEGLEEQIASVNVFDLRGAVRAHHVPPAGFARVVDLRDIARGNGQFIVHVQLQDGRTWAGPWNARN